MLDTHTHVDELPHMTYVSANRNVKKVLEVVSLFTTGMSSYTYIPVVKMLRYSCDLYKDAFTVWLLSTQCGG